MPAGAGGAHPSYIRPHQCKMIPGIRICGMQAAEMDLAETCGVPWDWT